MIEPYFAQIAEHLACLSLPEGFAVRVDTLIEDGAASLVIQLRPAELLTREDAA